MKHPYTTSPDLLSDFIEPYMGTQERLEALGDAVKRVVLPNAVRSDTSVSPLGRLMSVAGIAQTGQATSPDDSVSDFQVLSMLRVAGAGCL